MAGILFFFFSKPQSNTGKPQTIRRVSHSHTILHHTVRLSFLIRLAVSGSPILQREDDTFLSLCLLPAVASCDQLGSCATVVDVGRPWAAIDETMGCPSLWWAGPWPNRWATHHHGGPGPGQTGGPPIIVVGGALDKPRGPASRVSGSDQHCVCCGQQ